jgi:predicted phage-related endonuclease
MTTLGFENTIGSSDIAALVDASPWSTKWQIWQKMANGVILEEPDHSRIHEGTLLEPFILEKAAEAQDWTLHRNEAQEAFFKPTERARATVDTWATSIDHEGTGIIEAKLVNIFRFWDTWGRDDPKPPLHIELQIQWQFYMTGCTWGAIVVYAMGGDGEPLVFPREPDWDVIRELREANLAFWKSVDDMVEPDPAGIPMEVKLFAQVYPEVQDEVMQDLGIDEDIAEAFKAYEFCQRQKTIWNKNSDNAKVKLLDATKDQKRTIVTANNGQRFIATVSKSPTKEGSQELPSDIKSELRTLTSLAHLHEDDVELLNRTADWRKVTRKASVTTRITVKEIEAVDIDASKQHEEITI